MRQDNTLQVYYDEKFVGTRAMTADHKAAFQYGEECEKMWKTCFDKCVLMWLHITGTIIQKISHIYMMNQMTSGV